MNINNNFTPLAWHKGDIELQSNRATYAFGHIVPLLASSTTFIPFQIIAATGLIDITSASTCTIKLKNIDGTDAVNGNLFSRFGLVKVARTNYDVIIYNGTNLGTALPIGQYYLTLSSTVNGVTNTWYSDVVTIVSDTTKMTKITWWDEPALQSGVGVTEFGAGCIVYKYPVSGSTVQYKNYMYFLEELGMPEYTVEEEGEQRDGLFYSSKILSGKKYKMQVAQLSETMCDALRFVHLSDFVTVVDGYQRTYNCDSVLVTPEWQSGAVASASVEITTDTFVKQVGLGYITDQINTGVIGEAIIGQSFVIGAQ